MLDAQEYVLVMRPLKVARIRALLSFPSELQNGELVESEESLRCGGRHDQGNNQDIDLLLAQLHYTRTLLSHSRMYVL